MATKEDEDDKSPSNDADALENVLTHVGDMGRYQKLLFCLMMPFGVFYAYVYFIQIFVTVAPHKFWCSVPELAHLDLEVRRNLSAPIASSGIWDSCSTFDVNWTEVLMTMTPPLPDTPTVPCKHGWDFEFVDIPYATVTTERGWVCDNADKVPLAQAMFFGGSFVGGLIFGWLADNYGRVPALTCTNLITGIGGIATIFTTGAWDFVLCRFIVGMGFDSLFMIAYILVLEYVGSRHRTWVANISIALFFGSGCLSLPWLALWISDWRKLLWVTSLPMLLVVFVPFVMPESARWYVSRGRVNDAVKILRKFERVNGTTIPDDVMNEFIVSSNHNKDTDESLLVLWKSVPLRVAMVLIILVYMGASVVFDGLVLLSDAFGFDFFITFTLTAATEIPSVLLLALLLDRLGRRSLTAGPMALASLLLLIAIFVPKGVPQVTMAIIARFCLNMAYTAVVQWVTEMLPTGVRASGSATLHISGDVSAVLSPYIVYSKRVWTLLPLLIFGSIALVSSVFSIFLPETKGQPMPQTMADGERIVRENRLFGSVCAGKIQVDEEKARNNEKTMP